LRAPTLQTLVSSERPGVAGSAEDITMEFAEFYQHGGVFMHAVTLLSIIVAARLLSRVAGIRRTFRDPGRSLARLRQGDPLTPALVASVALVGALGTALGFIEVQAALRTVPIEQWPMANSMGSQIALYTLVWGLLCAIPLTLGHGVLAFFEHRLRALVEKHA
jgi:hypothetical protein